MLFLKIFRKRRFSVSSLAAWQVGDYHKIRENISFFSVVSIFLLIIASI
jgi:hypothetical protein